MRTRAFSLIELVIVIAIIAILAAVAVPRFSRGAEAARDSALQDNLASLHKAVELYAIQHGGKYPDAAAVVGQLTKFTDDAGNVSTERSETAHLGPYLHCIPPMSVGPQKGARGIALAAGPGVAWIYNPVSGQFTANLDP